MVVLLPVPAVMRPARTQSVPNIDNIWGRRTSILPTLGWKKSSDIEIVLDGEKQFIRSYSTFDEITGHVNLRFDRDTCIDDLAITFQGHTETWVEKLATTTPTTGRTTGKHTFMRVQQPIDQSTLPEFNRAIAGETYSIPFKFVVPDRILDFICSHRVDSEGIRDFHLQLPPTIGDVMLSGQGNTLMDDLCPNMAKISYTIRVGLLKASPTVRKPELIQDEIKIRIVPAREEQPPISVDLMPTKFPNKYCLRKEKNVRKGFLKMGKKQGRLTAESFQPASLKLPHPSGNSEEPVTTMTTVKLRYDPASAEEQPPALSNITSKLKVHTFYGAAPWSYMPSPDGYDVWSTLHSQYPTSIDLSTRTLSNVEWKKHEPASFISPVATTPTSVKPQISNLPSAYDRRSSKAVSIPDSYRIGTHGSRSTAENGLTRRASTFSNQSSTSSTESMNETNSCSTSLSESSSDLNQQNTSNLITSPSTSYDPSLPYYTASILVPITLPTTPTSTPTSTSTSRSQSLSQPPPTCTSSATPTAKSNMPKSRSKPTIFLPTFHSCLISRIYSLELNLHAASTSTITLHLPLQLSLPYHNQNRPASTATSPSTHQPAPQHLNWSNPFAANLPATTANSDPSPDFDADEEQLANDEAIARALSSPSSYSRSHSYARAHSPPHQPLSTVPEYTEQNTPQIAGASARHASLPMLDPHRTAMATNTDNDLPPEYNSHNAFRRVSAARLARLDSDAAERRNGKGEGRRRFSLLP